MRYEMSDSAAKLNNPLSEIKSKLKRAQLIVSAISNSVDLDPWNGDSSEDTTPEGDMFNLFELPRDLLLAVVDLADSSRIGSNITEEQAFETDLYQTANYFEMARRLAGSKSDNHFDRGNCGLMAESMINGLIQRFNNIYKQRTKAAS